jgi:hypothetical protein
MPWLARIDVLGGMTDVNARTGLGPTVLWSVAIAVVTVAAYLAFLGWDQHKDLDPVTRNETGPYEPWQVIGLGVVLAALAFTAGWRGRMLPAVVVLPAVLAACFGVDGATDPDGDGLWPIGAGLVAVGALAGTATLAAVGAALGSGTPHPGRRRRVAGAS